MRHQRRMQERGISLLRLWARLLRAAAANISYRRNPVLGFPGTPPALFGAIAHGFFSAGHANNIGFHTGATQAELGFGGTQELEREAIYAMAELAGAEDPEAQVDGYICGGGTEGNDHGLWLGRNMLLSENNGRVAVMASFLTHYSIAKSFGRLFGDQHLLCEMSTNMNGAVDGEVIHEEVYRLYCQGFRKFLVVLNGGTTNLGSIDQIGEVCRTLEKMQEEFRIRVHVHVDAAFGGFVLPFLNPAIPFGFEHHLVQSVSMDAHKMGFAPYSAGVFLCRKGLLEHTTTKATYLGGHSDSTVCGSRSGGIAAACWTNLHYLGHSGYRKIVAECMRDREYLQDQLAALDKDLDGCAYFYPTQLNILTARFGPKMREALDRKIGGKMSVRERFCIPYDHFPSDFRNPTRDKDDAVIRDVTVHRFVTMPHLTRRKIDVFVRELRLAAGIK